MSDRSLVYRISISTSDAKAQARSVRATFEAELRQINVGKLDTSSLKGAQAQAKLLAAELERAAKAGDLGQLDTTGIQRAVSEAQALRTALEQAGSAANNVKVPSGGDLPGMSGGGLGSLGGAFLGGFTATAAIAGIRELGEALNETARRGAVFQQLGDVLNDYARSVGTNADAMISAAKKASQGTISEYELILNANRAIQFEVAKTPEAFAKLIELSTALGRAQGIADTQALEFLTTGLARESRLILDNLGLIIDLDEATSRYAETLGKSSGQLSTAERKQALLEEAFRQGATAIEANREAADSAATQFERFDSNVQNLKDSWGQLIATMSADKIGEAANALNDIRETWFEGGQSQDTISRRIEEIKAEIAKFENAEPFTILGFDVSQFKEDIGTLPNLRDELRVLEEMQAATNSASDAFLQQEGIITNVGNALDMTGQKAKAVSAEVLKLYSDQGTSIDKALLGRAEKSVETIGPDQALAQYRQAKQDADRAMQALMDAGVTDATELKFRTAEILTSLLAPFDELEARASEFDLMSALGNFTDVGTALSGLNAGFVDFLPGLSAAREELITLSNEMALTGQLSDEQAARLQYLSAVAYSVADGGSALNAVVAELGGSFLESNAYAAELVNQLFMAEAAYAQGAITGDIYAGIMATLTGQLLTVAQGAGIATGAIMQLNAAQSGMASIGGLAIGGSIANRIQTQQQAAGREQNRREQERYNRDLERSQERSASRAGKLLEDGAKKANQELKSALDKVPGLFSTTQVTEQDMKDAELGVYQEKADEYLRRLRDEVQNGHDWEDVSLDEARAGLERAGLEVGATAEQTLTFLERSINDSSLFSAAENIPIFINEEAVKLAQELQKKSEEGRKNVYAYFGVQVDEAVTAATGGGGGAAVEVKPPEFVDIDPLTDGLQTGLDEYVATTGAVIKEQVATAKNLFFDPADLFGAADGAKTLESAIDLSGIENKINSLESTFDLSGIQAQFDSFVVPKPEIAVTADPAATALMPVVTGQVQPTVNVQFAGAQAGAQSATALQSEIDKLQITITPTLSDDAGQKLALALGDQLGKQSSIFISHGAVTGQAFLVGLQQALAVDDKGNVKIDIAGFIGNSLNTQAETLVAQGRGIAGLLQQGIGEGMAPAEGQAVAGGIAMQISSITIADGVRAPDVSVMAKIDKFAIDQTALYDAKISIPVELDLPQQQTNADGSQGANAITPLITSINTQIRGSQEGIKNQGITIAQILMAGLVAYFKGSQQTAGGEQAATPLADALMTNVATQFAATQNMFYAVGFGPAMSVESGFKDYGYTGLSSGLLDALTTGIRADAENYMQRGATIAGYVQAGMNQQFSAETGVRSAITAGAAWGNAFMQGVFEALNGAGFVDQITTNVIDGITGELEQP